MSWQDNALMWWSSDNGTTWSKITDHGRQPLDISVERIEKKNRMADGTLKRYSIAKKRTFNASWDNIPSRRNSVYLGRIAITTVDGGWAGEEIETFHNNINTRFQIKLRKGIDEAKDIADGTIEIYNVMFADFSKTIVKRGVVDFWSLNISLEEV